MGEGRAPEEVVQGGREEEGGKASYRPGGDGCVEGNASLQEEGEDEREKEEGEFESRGSGCECEEGDWCGVGVVLCWGCVV